MPKLDNLLPAPFHRLNAAQALGAPGDVGEAGHAEVHGGAAGGDLVELGEFLSRPALRWISG